MNINSSLRADNFDSKSLLSSLLSFTINSYYTIIKDKIVVKKDK